MDTPSGVWTYRLKYIEIDKPNKIWSTGITHITKGNSSQKAWSKLWSKLLFINGGTVYLVAITDWYSKVVLSWRISNTMNTDFVMDVLNKALHRDFRPEIFNTNQGSQYTSYIHTRTVKKLKIALTFGVEY